MTLVLFMLCSGFIHFTFVSSHLRFFNITASSGSLKNISKDCESRDESLLTLYDDEDNGVIDKYLTTINAQILVWVGLHKNPHSVPIWPEGVPVLKNDSSSNLMPTCVGIHVEILTVFDCTDKKYFMCYKDHNYTLIQNETRDWCQAQLYCKTHFTDLVSISNKTLNQVIEKGGKKTFWIGYMYDEWKWVDNSCSTYRPWSQGIQTDDCVALTLRGTLTSRDCTSDLRGICSKGEVRIKLIQKNKTWEEAFKYCKNNHAGLVQIKDEDDQEAVKQWLTYTDAYDTFWIGLRQSRTFGFWIWRDWTVSYNQWMNNTQPEMPLSNHCGVISKTEYKWSDEECSLKHYFLCEENISFMEQ